MVSLEGGNVMAELPEFARDVVRYLRESSGVYTYGQVEIRPARPGTNAVLSPRSVLLEWEPTVR